jgi:PRTRC genetic system protein B
MMGFEVQHEGGETVCLREALLIYGTQNAARYATRHEVAMNDGRPTIQAGGPLDRASLARLVGQLATASRLKTGVLPPNTLAVGGDFVVWWLPPGRASFFFRTAEQRGCVGHRAGSGVHPGLVFAAKWPRLFAVAVKGNERPGQGTALYHCPLMNVWDQAEICTGSMPTPEGTAAQIIAGWTRGFFDSAFTHANHAHAIKFKGGLHAFWTANLDGRFETFPEKVLVPLKTSLGHFIDMVEAS